MKALEQIPNTDTTCRLAAVFTDSKVTIDALKNLDNHSFLIEEMRSKVRHLNMQRWSIHFGWVKAHIGIEGLGALFYCPFGGLVDVISHHLS